MGSDEPIGNQRAGEEKITFIFATACKTDGTFAAALICVSGHMQSYCDPKHFSLYLLKNKTYD